MTAWRARLGHHGLVNFSIRAMRHACWRDRVAQPKCKNVFSVTGPAGDPGAWLRALELFKEVVGELIANGFDEIDPDDAEADPDESDDDETASLEVELHGVTTYTNKRGQMAAARLLQPLDQRQFRAAVVTPRVILLDVERHRRLYLKRRRERRAEETRQEEDRREEARRRAAEEAQAEARRRQEEAYHRAAEEAQAEARRRQEEACRRAAEEARQKEAAEAERLAAARRAEAEAETRRRREEAQRHAAEAARRALEARRRAEEQTRRAEALHRAEEERRRREAAAAPAACPREEAPAASPREESSEGEGATDEFANFAAFAVGLARENAQFLQAPDPDFAPIA